MIQMRYLFSIFLVVLLAESADAHLKSRIVGRVLDAESLKPLIGANVYIKGTQTGAATDRLGCYLISDVPPGRYRIIVRMMGYEEQVQEVNITPDHTTPLNFKLTEMVIPLGEIVVTGRREAISLATTTTQITQEDIDAQAALTVAEALKATPGVQVTMRCPYEGTGVYVRGFERHQTKVLIDGVPVYEPFRKVFDLSMIPAGSVSKIKIIKGPSSVLYGANTLGGVVNIITKKRTGKPLTELTCSLGRDRTQRYRIDHGAGFGRFNYWLSGSYGASDGFRLSQRYNNDPKVSPFENGGLRDNSDYIKRSLALRIGFAPNKEKGIALSLLINDNVAGLPVPPNPTKLTEGPNSYHWRFRDKDRWQVDLVSRVKPRDWLSIKVGGFYAQTWLTLDSYSSEKFTRLSYRNFSQSQLAGGFLHTSLRHHKTGLLKMGVGYQWDQNRRQDSRIEGTVVYELGTSTFGVEGELNIGARLSAVIGASYDILDPLRVAETRPGPEHGIFNPQGGLIFRLTDKTDLHLSVGKKTSFPTMRDLYWRKEEGGCWVGNPDLLPEEALTCELGIEHRVSNGLSSNIVFFRSDLRNLITTVAKFEQGKFWRRENIEKALMQGVETSIKFHSTPGFSGALNYTYMETGNRTAGPLKREELLYRPKHRANLDLRYSFHFGLGLSLQLLGSSEKSYYWVPSGKCLYQIPPGERPKGQIPAYLVSNGKLAYDLTHHLNLFFSVKNIFDTDWVDRGSPKMGYEPMPGRTILTGFRIRL